MGGAGRGGGHSRVIVPYKGGLGEVMGKGGGGEGAWVRARRGRPA